MLWKFLTLFLRSTRGCYEQEPLTLRTSGCNYQTPGLPLVEGQLKDARQLLGHSHSLQVQCVQPVLPGPEAPSLLIGQKTTNIWQHYVQPNKLHLLFFAPTLLSFCFGK
jgi:hypothetical protein